MNIFQRFFSGLKKKTVQIFFGGRSEYGTSGSLRDSAIIGGIANAIASNVAKLSPQVIRKDSKGTVVKNDKLSRLLNIRPCPECSTYDFLYRMAADLVFTSNAFAVIFWSDDYTEVERIQPISVGSHRIFEDEDGNVWFRFIWSYDNNEYTVPYQFVIHLKARYNEKRFLGTPPDYDLGGTLDLLNTTYQGIKNVVKNSASLRGYLKYNNFIDDKELQQKVNDFESAYLSAENEGGIAGIDNEFEFHEINQEAKSVPTSQAEFFRSDIYRYYGINEKILTGNYNAEEWNSFFESTIEPIAVQLSLEFTYKLFTERERGFGNSVIFTPNRLQYASLTSRASIGQTLFDRGVITINEYRELLYMPQIEDGDVRQISLNYVNTNNQSLYQVGRNEDGGADKSEANDKTRRENNNAKIE